MYIKQRDAVKIYYYMIAADGDIKQDEMEKFMEIGKETDDSFSDYKEEVIEECNRQLKKVIDEEEYFEVIKEGIEEILGEEPDYYRRNLTYGRIEASVILWNILSIVASDKEYSPEEQRLVRYVVRKLDIEKDIYLEMENAMKAIQDIDHAISWLSCKDKGFVMKMNNCEIASSKSVEIINQYIKRRDAIFNSVKEQIADNR